MTSTAPKDDDFYVGYLPSPARDGRWLRRVLPLVFTVLVLGVVVVARVQRDPGAAVWDTATPVSIEGTLSCFPYPHVLERIPEGVRTWFLAEEGKRGSQNRAEAWDGKSVRVTGWSLKREGRRVLELVPGTDGIGASGVALVEPAVEFLGRRTLRGEIVDYKCYLGAMKPGDGKAHKACATLCISRGIPGVLVTPAGEYIVITDAWMFLPLVGEWVEVVGETVRRGEVEFMKVDSADRVGP